MSKAKLLKSCCAAMPRCGWFGSGCRRCAAESHLRLSPPPDPAAHPAPVVHAPPAGGADSPPLSGASAGPEAVGSVLRRPPITSEALASKPRPTEASTSSSTSASAASVPTDTEKTNVMAASCAVTATLAVPSANGNTVSTVPVDRPLSVARTTFGGDTSGVSKLPR